MVTPPPPVRFAHAEYFASDPGWDHPGGWADVAGSVLRLEPYNPADTVLSVAPWAMTYGHLRSRALAWAAAPSPTPTGTPSSSAPWQNAQLVFDYRDAQNYKFAGLRVGGGRWVIGAVADGVETILADSTVAPPQANTWYKLDLVVARANGQDTVTLYANDSARVTWTRGSGQILAGGRVGVMVRGGAAHDTDAETEATEPHLTASVASVAASVSGLRAPWPDNAARRTTAQANTWYQLDVVVARVRGTGTTWETTVRNYPHHGHRVRLSDAAHRHHPVTPAPCHLVKYTLTPQPSRRWRPPRLCSPWLSYGDE